MKQREILGTAKMGMVIGCILATMCSLWVVAVYLLTSGGSRGGVSLTAVVAMYYGAGLLGGTVVGAMSHLRKTWVGMFILCLVGAAIVYFSVHLVTDGPFWLWSSGKWKAIFILAACTGIPTAIILRMQDRR